MDVRSKRGNKDDIERTIGNADISSLYVFVTRERKKKKKKCGYVCFAHRCKESILKSKGNVDIHTCLCVFCVLWNTFLISDD